MGRSAGGDPAPGPEVLLRWRQLPAEDLHRAATWHAEAVERKNMRFVPIKTDDQLDLQAIHRVRDRLISRRTAVINQLRAFLLERGMVFAQKPAKLKAAMADILENAESDLTPLMRNLIDTLPCPLIT
jgi:transposase